MKTRITKFLSMLLCLSLVATMLIGCGNNEDDDDKAKDKKKKVTAESLFENAYGGEEVESGDMNLCLVLDMEAKDSEDGQSISMDMMMGMDVDMLFDKDDMHLKGVVKAEVLGMTIEQEMEQYMKGYNEDEYTSYNYDAETDTWSYEILEGAADDSAMYMNMTELDFDELDDLKVDKDDNKYVVTGTITAEDMADSMGISTEDLIGDMTDTEGVDYEKMKYTFKAVFDEDKLLKSIRFDFDPETFVVENCEFKEYYIELTINSVNDTEVTIPDEIIENATEASDDDWEDDWGDDDWDDFEDDSQSSDIVVSTPEYEEGFKIYEIKHQAGVTTYAEFVAAHPELELNYPDEYGDDYVVNAGRSESINFCVRNTDTYTYMYIEFENTTNKAASLKDCVMTGNCAVSVDSGVDAQKYPLAEFMGLAVGDTINSADDLNAHFGIEYDSMDEYSSEVEYYYYFDNAAVYITVEKETNVITGLHFMLF